MTPSIESIEFHGIEALQLTAVDGSTAVVSHLGAQVLSWRTADGVERLYLSDLAEFDGSRSIRGGIPVCFPQFSNLGELPKHGLLRTRRWAVEDQEVLKNAPMVCLSFDGDEFTQALWPHYFHAELTVVLDANRLDVELAIENTGDIPFSFTAALHSYLRVKEVETVELQGLAGGEYRDAAKGNAIRQERGEVITVDDEVDRVYHGAKTPLLLREGNQRLGIDQAGFPDTVVWNPWETGCATLPDMAASDFRRMLCVEAAAAQRPVVLPAGEEWVGRQSLAVLG